MSSQSNPSLAEVATIEHLFPLLTSTSSLQEITIRSQNSWIKCSIIFNLGLINGCGWPTNLTHFALSNPPSFCQVMPSQRTFPSWLRWNQRRVASPSCCLSTMNRASSSSAWKWAVLQCSCMRTTLANPALRTIPCSEGSTLLTGSTFDHYF